MKKKKRSNYISSVDQYYKKYFPTSSNRKEIDITKNPSIGVTLAKESLKQARDRFKRV